MGFSRAARGKSDDVLAAGDELATGKVEDERDCQEFRVRAGGLTSSGHGPNEPLSEEDGELGLGHGPRARWHCPLLLGAVQDQKQ